MSTVGSRSLASAPVPDLLAETFLVELRLASFRRFLSSPKGILPQQASWLVMGCDLLADDDEASEAFSGVVIRFHPRTVEFPL